MKYRNLYDEFGNLTHEKLLKGEIQPKNRRILVSAIVIENNDNKLLMQKRSSSKGGTWAFTSGHIENDETSIDGIKREANEELGIILDNEKITKFNTGVNNKYVYDHYYIKKNIELDSLILQKEEVEDAKWLSLNEINNLISDGKFEDTHIIILDAYKKFNENYEI